MTFGEKLRELREKNNLTQKELGDKIGISARLISYYETNRTIPNDPGILNGIASIFDVTLDYLLGNPSESQSKLHKLVKKLITVTKDNSFKWNYFFHDSHSNDDLSYSFDLYSTSKFDAVEDQLVEDECFYASYNYGGYLLVRVLNSPSKTYRHALFVFYNNRFTFYACDEDFELIEDLFIEVKNQVLGIDSFVEDFLKDDSLGIPF